MDNTASTVFGSVTPPQSLTVCKKGTLTCGVTASTNYQLNIAGINRVFSSGTLNLGTSGSRMPSSSSMKWIFNPTVNVDSGIQIANNGTFNVYGDNTYGNTVACLLAANLSGGGTSCTTNVSTGWLSGDSVVFASTTQTATQGEIIPLTSNASGTTLSFTGTVANAHSGTSPTQGEIINLTRNVKIQGVSTSLQGFLYFDSTSIVNMSYYELFNLGSGTAKKRGVDIFTTSTGTCSLDHGSHHDFIVASSQGCNASGSAMGNNPSLSYMVFYNIANVALQNTSTSTAPTFTWDHIWVIKTPSTAIFSQSGGGIFGEM